MANEVHTSIEFYRPNDDAKKVINSLFKLDKETHADDYGRFDLYDIVEESAHDPKWAYVEDYDDYGYHVSILSAWAPPVPAIDKIIEKVSAVQKGLITIVRYEDEMPNFVGSIVYEDEEVVNEYEMDDEEMLGMLGIEELDADDRERIWDLCHEQVEKFVKETLDFIHENPN